MCGMNLGPQLARPLSAQIQIFSGSACHFQGDPLTSWFASWKPLMTHSREQNHKGNLGFLPNPNYFTCWYLHPGYQRRLSRVPWTARRSKQSILKEISPEYSLVTDAEAETPILWPPDSNNWLIEKTVILGKIEGWEAKGMTEDEMVGWHHRLNGHDEFE